MRRDHFQTGWFTDNGKIHLETARGQRARPRLTAFFVGKADKSNLRIPWALPALGKLAQSAEHGGHAALGIACAAPK